MVKMAVQTVVAFVSLVFITTVISELSHSERILNLKKDQNSDDDGSGLGVVDPLRDDEFTDVQDSGVIEDNEGFDELKAGITPVLSEGADEDTSVFPGSEEWSVQGRNGFPESQSPENNSAPTRPTSFENAAPTEPLLEDFLQGGETDDKDLTSHIFEKGGRSYLDISGVKKTELQVQNLGHVYGIVAESGQNCRLRKLVIAANHRVDRNIMNCHTLKNLTLSGSDWICGRDWSWLKELGDRGIVLHSDEAFCVDLRIPKPIGYGHLIPGFSEGITLLQGLGIKECPEICRRCLTVLTQRKRFSDYRVHCEKSNITDQNLPPIPIYTTHLFLENNKLQSSRKLFSHLEHVENITTIQLGGNKLDSIPFLKEKAFRKLNRLYLKDNNIREVDVEAFESIITREDIFVDMVGNIFPCDCNSHFFLKLCLTHVTKVNNLIKFPPQCINQTNNAIQVLTLVDECELKSLDPNDFMPILLVFLAVMNIIAIYLVYDLVMAIRECRGQGSQFRDPKFHHLVLGCQRLCNFVFKRDNKNRRGEERNDPADFTQIRSHDTPVILRTNRLSSAERESTMRIDRRRLTPCPN